MVYIPSSKPLDSGRIDHIQHLINFHEPVVNERQQETQAVNLIYVLS